MRASDAVIRAWLVARWHDQAEKFPTMRRDTPLELYVRVNLPYARKMTRFQEV